MSEDALFDTYGSMTPKEIERQKREQLLIDRKVKAVINSARKCINSPDFAKYKKLYEDCERFIINKLIENQEADPIKYALFSKACLAKLSGIKMMLDSVVEDAKKATKKDKNES